MKIVKLESGPCIRTKPHDILLAGDNESNESVKQDRAYDMDNYFRQTSTSKTLRKQ